MLRHVVVLASVGVLWGCSEQHSVDSPEPVAGSKLAVKSFTPVKGHDYDPFKVLNREDRKASLGGIEGATAYFELVAAQLASAMHDKEARRIIHTVISSWKKGDIKLSAVAIEYPHFAQVFATGFKEAMQDKRLSNQLAQIAQRSATDGKALFQVLGAMVDIEVILALPEDQSWDGSEPIAVIWSPIERNPDIVQGIGTNLKPIRLNAHTDEPPYPLLSLNFDEDQTPEEIESTSSVPVNDIWNWSLITPAYAHNPTNHPNCNHFPLIKPVYTITIFKTHETWGDDPEIYIKVLFYNNVRTERFDLPDVNRVNKPYKNYRHLKTIHGPCNGGRVKKFHVLERDYWGLPDDTVACWEDVVMTRMGIHELLPSAADCGVEDAWLHISFTGLD